MAGSCSVLARTTTCSAVEIVISTQYLLHMPLVQDPIFKPNHYLSLLEFRQQTLERLQKFVAQRFFVTKDYIDSESHQNFWLYQDAGAASPTLLFIREEMPCQSFRSPVFSCAHSLL